MTHDAGRNIAGPVHSLRNRLLVRLVCASSIVLLVLTLVVERSMIRFLNKDANKELVRAHAVFQQTQRTRLEENINRFRLVCDEKRFLAVCQTRHSQTIGVLLEESIHDLRLAGAVCVLRDGQTVSRWDKSMELLGDQLLPKTLQWSASLSDASPPVEWLPTKDAIYEVYSIPIALEQQSLASVCFLVKVDDASLQTLRKSSFCEIVFFHDGKPLVTTAGLQAYLPASTKDLRQMLQESLESRSTSETNPSRILDVHGESWIAIGGSLKEEGSNSGVSYLLLQDYSDTIKLSSQVKNFAIGTVVVALSCSIIVMTAIVLRMLHPIQQLQELASAVAAGDFSRRVTVESNDELGMLSRTFNDMNQNLYMARNALECRIDELKTAQAQLKMHERLSAIGECMGGVAHELSSPISTVLLQSEMLMLSTTMQPEELSAVKGINSEARRCKHIVHSMLSLSRNRPVERRRVSIHNELEAVSSILEAQLKNRGVALVKRLDDNLPDILADGYQLQQVFLNLVTNAVQALEGQRMNGRVEFATSHDPTHVHIVISDNGPGISSADLDRIFEPFFTTKAEGKGTGLGLSICYNIVTTNEGTISVQSTVGRGTSFKISFPILTTSRFQSETAITAKASPRSAAPTPPFTGTPAVSINL